MLGEQAALGIALELLSVALFVIRSIAFDDKLESVTMLHVGKLIYGRKNETCNVE